MGRITTVLTRLALDPVNYWGGVLVDATLAGCFLVHARRAMHGTWVASEVIVLALASLCLYGLLEYLAHRWVYHDDRSPATPGHRLHHEDPEALIALPFFVPATVVVALWGLLRPVLGDGPASVVIVALMISFLYYGLVHHGVHHWRPRTRYFRTLRSHHRIHHQFPDRNFGVTMTVWDWVFGTHYQMMKHREHSPRGPGPTPRMVRERAVAASRDRGGEGQGSARFSARD